MIHTVKGFGIVNKAEVDVFLELSCFFYDSVDTELVFDITREELAPLLTDLRRVLADIDNAT